ncbi:MAG: SGNH/GDSL hydrolase family protein [Candidatus Zixiibacteriota bacterium]
MTSNYPTPSLAFKLTASVLSVCLFLALAELALRFIDPDLYYKNQFFPVNRDIDFPDVYKKDPMLFWRFRENQTISSRRFSDLDYRINSLGMRGPEIARTKNGVRILTLGNSCTFGWGVRQEQIWTTRLQEMLKRGILTQSIEVVNAGVPGYSSLQGWRYFENELLVLQPDIVLITFAWNDEAPAGQGISDDRQQPPGRLILAAQNLFSRLKLYQFMRKVVLSATEKQKIVALDDPLAVRRVPPDRFKKNLTEIIRLARRNNCRPVLVIPPIASLHIYFKESVSPLHTMHAAYQNQIRLVSQYEKTELVDLQEAFDKQSDLWDDPYADCTHFNAKGHGVAAQTIAEVVVPR